MADDRDAALRATAVSINAWVDQVAVRFPWRARLLRRMVRSPFWLQALMTATRRRA